MRMLAEGVGYALLVAAIGCSDQPSQPRTPQAFAPEFSQESATSAKQQGIAGAADFTYVDGLGQSFNEHLANAAIRQKDGTIKGEFEWKQTGRSVSQFDGKFGGDIVCFAISGRTARVSGRIERSNSSHLPPGTYIIWQWRDNDDISKKAPDTITNFFVASPETAANHCVLGGTLDASTFYPAQHGKLEILHDDK